MISDYKKADKNALGAENCAVIEDAIAAVEAVRSETVINEAKWNAVETNLENAMINAGLREKTETSAIESAFTSFTKQMNQILNKVMK